ncbi:Rv1355c family protein [Actinomycetospora endophytica]|uniref:Rv1355c family protein n=1 Tax=Actinomycetospora endophytica TaxID=2291215 RepID=A0ABS8P5U9_9PSEU|nr:Rv1355c family protein [Actinomycetospora endophytica]MCD2193636.1 Rv1355c family protein [Actinomycetospora endophytica]
MSTEAYRAVLLDEAGLASLRAGTDVVVLDQRAAQRADLAELREEVPDREPDVWAFYPWRRTVVGLIGPEAFTRLRLDRNRNKITAAEQARLRRLQVGVAGLSVGHAVAHTLALEGLCGQLRLADFDGIDVSNLNRIPATVLDLGVNKAVVAARRVAELDPHLDVRVVPQGVTDEVLDEFLDGLDVLVEEADSLDVKVALREGARRRGIPVLMVTSDRGLLDVERFDSEPDRPLFHGLVGELDSERLCGLATADKVTHVMRILGAADLSPRIAASMVEVGRTLSTWPQLCGEVALGAATVAAAVRRLGLGRPLGSGRVRIDLDEALDDLGDAVCGPGTAPDRPAAPVPPAPVPAPAHSATPAVLEAVRRAPSGGNVQPWHVESDADEVRLLLDRERTTTMDVDHRGSYVALGAALFNARTAAAAAGALGPVAVFPDPGRPDLVATLRFGTGHDERLAARHPGVLTRATDRARGRSRPLEAAAEEALQQVAAEEGASLHLVAPGHRLRAAAEVIGAADRIRFLTPRLHREMFDELVWPDAGPAPVGIDVTALGLDAADQAKLAIARRPEVMALLAEWDRGTALAEDTHDRVVSSSALAVMSVPGTCPADFVRGGAAVEATWVEAQARGLAVHPVSPAFLFAVVPDDLRELSDRYAAELGELQARFRATVGLDEGETIALVLRLSHTDAVPVRSRRRSIGEILRTA